MKKLTMEALLAGLAGNSLSYGAPAPFVSGMSRHDRNRYNQLLRIKRTEARQRRGSQYARDRRGEPGRNGGPKGM